MAKAPSFQSRNEQVYEHVRAMIIRGDLEPGSRLIVDRLALTLGVSHIPIREALSQLEADGFVEKTAYVGVSVSELKADAIRELFELLAALETISARAASKRMGEVALSELEALVVRMDAHTGDPDLWSAENKRLHEFICEQAGTPFVKKTLHLALDHWDRLRNIYLKEVSAGRIALAQREHHDLLDALKARDEARLEGVIRTHNQKSLSAYLEYLETTGSLSRPEEASC